MRTGRVKRALEDSSHPRFSSLENSNSVARCANGQGEEGLRRHLFFIGCSAVLKTVMPSQRFWWVLSVVGVIGCQNERETG